MNIKVNEDYCLDDCVFFSENDAVIFSPFTSETLLCERSVLDFLISLDNQSVPIEEVMGEGRKCIDEIIEKLVSMRIILLKE